MSIETKVHVEIERRLNNMKDMDPTTEEYKANNDAVAKLLEKAAEMERIHIEQQNYELNLKRMEEERTDRKVKNGLTALGIVIPPTVALIAGFAYSVMEREVITTSTPAKELLRRALRLS